VLVIKVVLNVNASPEAVQSIKETLAMYCERFGDTRVVSITTDGQRPSQTPQDRRNAAAQVQPKPKFAPEQMAIGGKPWQQESYNNGTKRR
jgi:hypothetical protein